MAGDDRDEEGRYIETYPDEAFLEAIDVVAVASTQNIADQVGCSYDLAYRRLKQLQSEDVIDAQEVRSAFVWLRADS